MVKVWCEECYASGCEMIQQSSYNIPYFSKCKICNGKGYTDESVVKVSEVSKMFESAMYDSDTFEEFHRYFHNRLEQKEQEAKE